MPMGLTKRQAEALGFIRGFIRENGYSPSYDEIAAAMGFKSKSNVVRVVRELHGRGVIDFGQHRGRSITVLAA